MSLSREIYIETAKFLQNILLENNIKCFLIGGALINSVRDNGVLNTEDIDFAILNDEVDNMDNLIDLFERYLPYYTWNRCPNFLSINIYADQDKKIDFFKFSKKHMNYYMYDMNWIHERINHFQTFKTHNVILENKSFRTMYRPDLFLKTVYGDYSIRKNEYKNLHGGDTSHLHECIFYINSNNFSTIDFKIENLKLFFKTVHVKNDISAMNHSLINVLDDSYINLFSEKTNLFYKDFRNHLITNKIMFDDF